MESYQASFPIIMVGNQKSIVGKNEKKKNTKMWSVNNMLLKNQWLIKDIKGDYGMSPRDK